MLATAFFLTAFAHMAAVMGRPAAAIASLTLVAASAAALLFRSKHVGAAALSVSLAFMAGALGWPAPSPQSWLVSTASWLVLTLLSDSMRPSRNPVGAITVGTGIAVFAREGAGAAWVDSFGEIRCVRARPIEVISLLLRQVPVSFCRRGSRVSFRRLHGAEHVAITAAWAGVPPDPGISHVTIHCGGTISATVVLTAGIALLIAPTGLHPGVIVAWSTAAGVSLREAAISSRWLSFALAPGLWLQKLTTAPPGPLEMEVALAALRAATGSGSRTPWN